MSDKRNVFREVDRAAMSLGFNLHHPGNPDAAKHAATAYGQHLATKGAISADNAKYITSMKLHGGTSNGAEAYFNSPGANANTTGVPVAAVLQDAEVKARSSKKSGRKA